MRTLLTVFLSCVLLPVGSTMAVQKQPRDQQTLELIFVDPDTFARTVVLTEVQPQWVNLQNRRRCTCR